MTMIIVVLFGVGIVFIASALDGTSIIDTVTKIISGKPIDWSGKGQSQ